MNRAKALRSLWTDKMKIEVSEYKKDEATKKQVRRIVKVAEDEPCRVSFSAAPAASDTDGVAAQTQSVKLFCSPDMRIEPGSRITVTRGEISTAYAMSGVPAMYKYHQEINLELFERWA